MEPAVVPAPEDFLDKSGDDLEDSPSVQIETRVNPNDILTMGTEDKESKNIISEKKIVDLPKVPSPSPQNTQDHSPAPVSFINAPKPTTPDLHTSSPEQLYQYSHQESPNAYYLRPSTSSQIIYESTAPYQEPSLALTTNVTSSETAQVLAQNPSSTFESPSKINNAFLMPPFAEISPNFKDFLLPKPVIRPASYSTRSNLRVKGRYPNTPPLRSKPFKKYYPRSPYQGYRPYNVEFDRTHAYQTRQQPIILMSLAVPALPMKPRPAKTNLQQVNNTIFGTIKEVKHVQISPQQASTEREPEIQTASATNLIDITPTFMRPATNTGFKPSSVKMETGFKPIITKEIQDRMDQADEEIEIEDEGETGVIDKDNENNYEYKPFHVFEPMFIPSPTDKFAKEKNMNVHKRPFNKKHQHFLKIIIKQPRTFNDTQDELVAEAAERAETYYLPPVGQVPKDVVQEPSNIDIETPESDLNLDSPPDVVVTYDGKRVSGQSLTAKISERPSAFESRISKASTFIRARPQFGKFSGELPPLNPESLFGGTFQSHAAGVLSRELDTPALPSTGSGTPSSTKLTRVASLHEGSGRKTNEAYYTSNKARQG